jgi:transposase InsO family protein
MWQELRYLGEPCSRNRVARLMRDNGLRGIPQRRRWRTKPTGTRPDHVQNHLARDFKAHEPNTKWVTDIERHEALSNRAVMKGHGRQYVAADWLKLRAA